MINLFKSQWIQSSTIEETTNQIKLSLLVRGENRSTQGKISQEQRYERKDPVSRKRSG